MRETVKPKRIDRKDKELLKQNNKFKTRRGRKREQIQTLHERKSINKLI